MSLFLSRSRGQRRGRPSLFAAGLALAAALFSTTALADERAEAKRHFKAGMALIAQKKFPEGIGELERAYEIQPHPFVAYNIALAQAEGGSIELAIKAFRVYLKSNPDDRATVEETVKKLEDKLAAQRAAEANPPPPPKPDEKKPDEPKPGEKKPDQNPEPVVPKPPEPVPAIPKPDDTAPIAGKVGQEDVYAETVVTASRGKQSPLDSPNSTTIITKQDIRLSGITRIPELLRRVAGMDVMEITGGDENVSMRGFNHRLSNKLLVLVDGRSVYNDILGSTFWETLSIDVDQVERIEVVRGPGSALYGANAFAGVVNIITIAPGEGRPGMRVGAGDHGQVYGSAWATGREGDFGYRVSGGYTRYPRWTREISGNRRDVAVGDYADLDLGSQNVRLDGRVSYRINKDNELIFGGGFSRVDLNIYGEGPLNDYFLKGDILEAGIDYKGQHFNAKTYYNRLAVNGGESYQYLGHTLYPTNATQNVFDAEVEYVNDFHTGPLGHDIHVGVGYRLKDIDWNYLSSNIPVENHGSAYLQDTIKIGSHVSIVGSGRVDYEPYLKRIVGSPRGSVLIKPNDKQVIRLSGSTAFRAPTYLEAYLNLPVQVQLPGAELISSAKSPDKPDFILQPEQITSAEVSYLNQQSDYLEFEINAYYNRVTNLIELAQARPQTLAEQAAGVGGLDLTTGRYTAAFGGWDNECDIYNVFGGEVGVRAYPVEGLDLFANYALNVSNQQRPAGCTVPEDKRTSMHKFNAGVQLRTKIGFNGEITFHYQSAQTWNEQVATSNAIVYQQFPLPAYTLLNGRVGWRFYKDRAELSATVFNALADVFGPPAQEHPFGNRVGRRVMGFFSYSL